jgi:riboflavin kinase
MGYLNRIHTANGITVQLTDKGRTELLQVLNGLEVALTPTAEEIIIQGQVMDGLGEGAYYVDVYSSRFKEALGFSPFPGTLNVRVSDEESRKAIGRMRDSPPLVVRGFNLDGRTFGEVICYRVKINEKAEVAVVIAQRTHHSQDTLEVIAPVNLRKKLSLSSSDTVVLRFVPLHLVT